MERVLHFSLLCTIHLLLYVLTMFAQQNPIPNQSFELWSGNNPVGWTASSNIPGFENVTKSTDAYSGSFSVHGEVTSIAGNPLPPVIFTGSITDQNFPVSERHQTFTCRYKFHAESGDGLYIEVVLANTIEGGAAEGHEVITSDVSSFTEVEIQIIYDPGLPAGWVPNIGNITVTILPPQNEIPHIGTSYNLDHLSFDGYPVGVNETGEVKVPDQYRLEQNYPNPFNPSTKINFSIPEESFVTLKIFNIQGEEITTLINKDISAGSYNIEWYAGNIPSGIYFYTLNAGSTMLSRKMILMK